MTSERYILYRKLRPNIKFCVINYVRMLKSTRSFYVTFRNGVSFP